MKPKNINVEKVNNLVKIKESVVNITNNDIKRSKFRPFIIDKKQTKKIDDRYLTINEIKNIKRGSKTDRDFLQYLNSEKIKESLKKYPVLYEFIVKILIEKEKSKNEIPILERLKQVVDTKDKELIVKYIKKHTEEIRLWLETFKEEKIKHELVYLLYLINEDEIEYTRKKLEELKPLNKDINPFIEKIILGLKVIGEKQKRYDKKLIKELGELKKKDIELKEKEIEYLNSELTNIEKWQVRGYSEEYFYQILAAYERQVRDIVRVLRDNFKDKELKSVIEKNPAIRNLVFYTEEIHYFDKEEYYDHKHKRKLGLLGMVYKGSKEGDWKDFLDTVKNVKKEAKFVREHFGDKVYAERLLAEEAKKHESLQDWEGDLANVVAELKGPSNLNKVIEEAKSNLRDEINKKLKLLYEELQKEKEKLKDILERRINYLINENKKAITKLDKTVTERLKELRNIEKVSVRKIMNKLRIEDIKLNAEWGKIRRKYSKMEDKYVDYLMDFMDKFNVLSERLDLKEDVNGIVKFMHSGIGYNKYMAGHMNGLEKMDPSKGLSKFGKVFFASGVAEYIDESIFDITTGAHDKVDKSEKSINKIEKLHNQVIVSQRDVLNALEGIKKRFLEGEVKKIELKINDEKVSVRSKMSEVRVA